MPDIGKSGTYTAAGVPWGVLQVTFFDPGIETDPPDDDETRIAASGEYEVTEQDGKTVLVFEKEV